MCPGGDLVGDDAQPFAHHAAHEAGGMERSSLHTRKRVGTSGHASSGHGCPIGVADWPRSRSLDSSASSSRDVVVVDVALVPLRRLVGEARVRPPVTGRFPRGRDQRLHQHEHVGAHPPAHERGRESAE